MSCLMYEGDDGVGGWTDGAGFGGMDAGRGVGGDTLLLIKPPCRSQKHFDIQIGPGMCFWRGKDGKASGLKVRVGPRR